MEQVSLKEHLEKINEIKEKYNERIHKLTDIYQERLSAEKDKARNEALASLNQRLSLLNELRGGVATKEEVKALEKVIDDLKASRDKTEGKYAGVRELIAWVLAAIAIVGFIIKYK